MYFSLMAPRKLVWHLENLLASLYLPLSWMPKYQMLVLYNNLCYVCSSISPQDSVHTALSACLSVLARPARDGTEQEEAGFLSSVYKPSPWEGGPGHSMEWPGEGARLIRNPALWVSVGDNGHPPLINPRRACVARVMVLVLCVCVFLSVPSG